MKLIVDSGSTSITNAFGYEETIIVKDPIDGLEKYHNNLPE